MIDEEEVRQIVRKFLSLSFKNKGIVWNRARQQRAKTANDQDTIVTDNLTELVDTITGLTEEEFDFFCRGIEIPVLLDAAFPHA